MHVMLIIKFFDVATGKSAVDFSVGLKLKERLDVDERRSVASLMTKFLKPNCHIKQ